MVNLPYIICSVLSFIPALVLHEVAHGYAAYKLGDPTAKRSGRLSLNPLKHIDPFGTVILPLLLMVMGLAGVRLREARALQSALLQGSAPRRCHCGFGRAFRQPRHGRAGGCGGVGLLGASSANPTFANNELFAYFYVMFLPTFALINLYLMFFNLLPIPPLDGSSIFAILLPPKYLPKYYQIQQYAFPVFMIAIVVLPYVFNFNPFSWYLGVTAGNLFDFMFPPFFS